MKKLLIIVLFVSMGITRSQAQSMMKVSMADNSVINVAVDGRYFNKRGTSVTVGDLPPGRHFLQIYAASPNRRGRMFQDIVYEGKVRTAHGFVALVVYDPETRNINIQEQDINTFNANRPPYARHMPQQGENYDTYGNNDNGGNGNNDYAGNGSYNNNNTPPPPPVNPGTLTTAKIDDLKTKVGAKNTDTEKMNVIKDALKDEQITTAQVGDMMDLFNFESSKVDFAEWAYTITVDKENFTTLENKCAYKNYQDDLDKFIKAKQ